MEPRVWTTGFIVAVMLIGLIMCAEFKTEHERLEDGCKKACLGDCSVENLQNCSGVEKYQRCIISCLKLDQCKDIRLIIEHYAAGYYQKGMFGCPDDEIYQLGEAGAKLKAEDPNCGTGIVSCQKPMISAIIKKKSTHATVSEEEFCASVKKEADCESEVIQCKCGDYKAYLGYLYTLKNHALYAQACVDVGAVTPEAVKTCGAGGEHIGASNNAVAVSARMRVLVSLAMITHLLLLVR